MFANVSIINVPISLILDYQVPEKFIQEIKAGMVVVVPLANRKAFGVILQLSLATPSTPELVDLEVLLDPKISISPEWLTIANQLADDLFQPVGKFLEKMLPRSLGYSIDKSYSITLDPESKLPTELLDLLNRYGKSKISAIRLSDKDQKTIDKFSKNNLIHPEYLLNQKISKPRNRKIYLAFETGTISDTERNFGRDTDTIARRMEAFDYIRREGPVEDQWIFASSGCNSADLKWLTTHGLIKEIETGWSIGSAEPNRAEERIVSDIQDLGEESQFIAGFDEKEIYLIKHDRGAEILNFYFSMIQKNCVEERSCFLIFPTIFEVESAANSYQEKTGNKPEIFHSKLSDSMNLEVWSNVRKGEAKVFFGTTDVLFCQSPNPSLIIIDEPQDCRSFGQQSFVYNAMSIADRIHQHFKTRVLYSSIQPSIKDWFDAKYRLKRQFGGPLLFKEAPRKRNELDFQIIDMASELKNGNKSVISRHLQIKIQESLIHQKMTILFLNRKGYANYLFCRDCGYIRRCDSCGSTLNLHSNGNLIKSMQICIHCGKRNLVENQCPKCSGSNYRSFGAGIKKVEEICSEMFPQARVAVWEYSPGNNRFNEILYERVLSGQVDVLIGTSAVIKNVHFPKLGTIGIILAESSLSTPDIYKQEYSFKTLKSLISLGSEDTTIVLQTYQPNERTWAQLKNFDDKAFIDQQLEIRHRFKFPPFGTIVKLTFRDHDPEKCLKIVREMERQINLLINNNKLDEIQITLIPPEQLTVMKSYSSHLIIAGNGIDLIRYLNFQPGWRVDLNPTSIY